jgi:hypothetical protein
MKHHALRGRRHFHKADCLPILSLFNKASVCVKHHGSACGRCIWSMYGHMNHPFRRTMVRGGAARLSVHVSLCACPFPPEASCPGASCSAYSCPASPAIQLCCCLIRDVLLHAVGWCCLMPDSVSIQCGCLMRWDGYDATAATNWLAPSKRLNDVLLLFVCADGCCLLSRRGLLEWKMGQLEAAEKDMQVRRQGFSLPSKP